MKTGFLFFWLAIVTAAPLFAEPAAAPVPPGSMAVSLKDGTRVASTRVRRDGAQIAVTVRLGAAGFSETRYPINAVARVDFPRPPAIHAAEEKLVANDAAGALAAIAPVVREQNDFREIPGNWWAPAAVVQVKSLVALRRYGDAEKFLDELAKAADPEDVRAARLQIAMGWARQGDFKKAQAVFDDAIAQSTKADTVALAWVGKGNAFLGAKDYDSALVAFLRVPIFYSQQKEAMPAALLGSGRAYLHVGEGDKARESFEQIIATYPKSPSAADARAELAKLSGEPATPS